MTTRLFLLLASLGTVAGSAGFGRAAEALPSESLLPGQVALVAPRAALSLPSESELPTGYAAPLSFVPVQAQLPDAILVEPVVDEPSPSDRPPTAEAPPPPRELPSESALPAAWSADGQQLPPADDDAPIVEEDRILNLAQSVDAIPWLRLNLPGHVGPVRALVFTGDSGRLCSAGEDKAVLIWQRGQRGAVQRSWQYQRSVYWQVQRGNSGRIYALAASDNLIAVGGHGAMGGLGEILLLDAVSGNLQTALYNEQIGHRQVIVSLAFSPDPQSPGLASIDRDGRALYWRPDPETGLWSAKLIQPPDRSRYGAEVAQRLYPYRGTAPLVMTDGSHVVLPVYAQDPRQPNSVCWQLQEIDVATGEGRLLPGQQGVYHLAYVTALAVTPDGSRLASADAAQLPSGVPHRFFLWDRQGGRRENRVARVPLSLSYSGDGKTLAVGTAQAQGQAQVEIWNVADPRQPRRTAEIAAAGNVTACALSPDAAFCAFSQGNDVLVRSVAAPAQTVRLGAPVRPPLRIAFARQEPFDRLALGVRRQNNTVPLEQVFDTAAVQLSVAARINENDWVPEGSDAQGWNLEIRRDSRSGVETYRLTEKGQPRGDILLPANSGAPGAWAWIPNREGRPLAVAIGARGSSNIYVYRLAERGACPLLRVFRGHAGAVTSLSVSRDFRYLASAAMDATIRVWPLAELDRDEVLVNRWGALFEVQDGQLIATSVREDGPLYFRGVRSGDSVQRLRWATGLNADGNVEYQSAEAPAAMLQALRDLSWETVVAFDYARGRTPARAFQIRPAWQQLVSLVVAENREWAYWTPSGYYDASFEGHKLFGWQVNRGLQALPDFFLAAQLRKTLERPEAMSRLLAVGSIDAAFRAIRAEAPAQPHRAVAEAYFAKPDVQILSPVAGQLVKGETVSVQAAITVRNGQRLVPPKAFANGVVAVDRQLVSEESVQGGRKFVYQWQARLPSDRQIVLLVAAATDGQTAGLGSLVLEHEPAPPRRPPQLFVMAAGINEYRDAQVPKLDYAVNNAAQLALSLRERAAPLYGTDALSLINDDVTKPVWRSALDHYADQLRERVGPDDLLVVFLSGHGIRDPELDTYYYITANARYQDVTARRYGDCLSFEDFSRFADVPCRKLVILDTCHSGAVQPLRQRELKSALRALQDDVVFTLTASEGSQEAVEERNRRLGRFTSRLLEALQGAADQQDGDRNGVVSWAEVVRYVKRTVAADSAGAEQQQHPTAGPMELLDVADYPLTKAEPPQARG